MPRRSRCVVSGVPYHITQRGVDKCVTFSGEEDRQTYLRPLRDNLSDAEVRRDFERAFLRKDCRAGIAFLLRAIPICRVMLRPELVERAELRVAADERGDVLL